MPIPSDDRYNGMERQFPWIHRDMVSVAPGANQCQAVVGGGAVFEAVLTR